VAGWIIAAFAAAPVVLHLTDSANLPPDHPGSVMVALVRGIERATEKEVLIDDVSQCPAEPECIDEIAAQFGATEVVLVRLVGAVRTGRAVVSLGAPSLGMLRRVDLEYPLERTGEWPGIFGGVAAILFPTALRAPPQKAEIAAPPPPPEPDDSLGSALSWTAIGTGAGLAIAATGLRVHSNAVRRDVALETDPMIRDDLMSESNAHGLASNLLFGIGAVAIASGVVYLLTR
jgi:hypothetical protein